jgi:hypothetical protein
VAGSGRPRRPMIECAAQFLIEVVFAVPCLFTALRIGFDDRVGIGKLIGSGCHEPVGGLLQPLHIVERPRVLTTRRVGERQLEPQDRIAVSIRVDLAGGVADADGAELADLHKLGGNSLDLLRKTCSVSGSKQPAPGTLGPLLRSRPKAHRGRFARCGQPGAMLDPAAQRAWRERAGVGRCDALTGRGSRARRGLR